MLITLQLFIMHIIPVFYSDLKSLFRKYKVTFHKGKVMYHIQSFMRGLRKLKIKNSISFNGFCLLFFKPDGRFWESWTFCSFCSLQQVSPMFSAIDLPQADGQGLPALKVLVTGKKVLDGFKCKKRQHKRNTKKSKGIANIKECDVPKHHLFKATWIISSP